MGKVLVLEKKMNCNLKTSKLLAYWRFLAHTAEKKLALLFHWPSKTLLEQLAMVREVDIYKHI